MCARRFRAPDFASCSTPAWVRSDLSGQENDSTPGVRQVVILGIETDFFSCIHEIRGLREAGLAVPRPATPLTKLARRGGREQVDAVVRVAA